MLRSIFISYAHSDGLKLAFRLQNALIAAGHQVWLDRSQLAGGMEWGREIERAIAQCDCELALLSEASFHSDICRAEQLMCLDARKPVIPLLVQANARRPVHLFARQYYDFSDEAAFDTHFAELTSLLAAPDLPALYSPAPAQSADPVHLFVLQTSVAHPAGQSDNLPPAVRAAVKEQIGLTATAASHHHGSIYRCTGEGCTALFHTARACLSCARELAAGFTRSSAAPDAVPLQWRMALHGGELQPVGAEYFGPVLSRANRICQICHPGQVLLSGALVQADVTPAGATLVDLGLHYLGDADEPEHLYQLVDEQFAVREFPPLPTLDRRPNNLVQQFSRFVGRARELAELQNLLLGGQRLVTITAPGGYGKSRLAAQLCADLLPQFESGVFMVELAPLLDPAQIVYQLAGAIGFRFYGSREPEEQLIDYLREKQLLLCLDNFEHLLAGAPLVSRIIQAAPQLRIVVTSRELLNIAGEKPYELWPLPVAFERDMLSEAPRPEPVPAWSRSDGGSTAAEQLAGGPTQLSDAARLFADRAMQRNVSLAGKAASSPLIELICAKLSGIPLAIELAAAWMDGFTLPELHAELSHQLELEARASDEPERHHSLKACLDWSWQLLGTAQQETLMRLATFRGGFFSEAAGAVLNMTGMALRTALMKLCDKSWLTTRVVDGHTRFYLRDALAHEYSLAKLEETRGAEDSLYEQAMRAHAAYFAALVEREGPRLTGGGIPDGGAVQKEALRSWRIELENIYAAMDLALKSGDEAGSLSFVRHLPHYLSVVGEFISLRDRYTELLEEPLARSNAAMQLLVQAALATAYRQLGALVEARETAERTIELAEQLGNRGCVAGMLFGLGVVELYQDNYSMARSFLTRTIDLCRELNDRPTLAYALNNLAIVERMLGNYPSAQALSLQSLALMRAMGDRRGEGSVLQGLGVIEDFQGNIAAAICWFQQALAISCELGTRWSQAVAYNSLAVEEEQLGHWSAAEQHFKQSLAIKRELGDRKGEAITLAGLGQLEQQQRNYNAAREYLTQALTLDREIGSLSGECNCLYNLAATEFEDAQYNKASELAGRAQLLAHAIGKKREEAYAAQLIAAVAARQGDSANAWRLAAEALQLQLELNDKQSIVRCCALSGTLLARRGHYRAAVLAGAGFRHLEGSAVMAQDTWALDEARARLAAAADDGSINAEELGVWQAEGEAMELEELARFLLAELQERNDVSVG